MYGGDRTVKLIESTREYCRKIEAYRNAFLECGDSMDGTGDLRQFDNPEDWIRYLEKHRDPLTVPKGRVPSFMSRKKRYLWRGIGLRSPSNNIDTKRSRNRDL
jgi:hypothetical protein